MSTNKLTALKAALTAATLENDNASASGVAKWDDALEFAYTAMPLAEHLIKSAEFLADALPGIKAYAENIGNENYRNMWFTQIAKYEASLAALGLAPADQPAAQPASAVGYVVTQDEVQNVLDQYVLRIVDTKGMSTNELAAQLISTLDFTSVSAEADEHEHPILKRQTAFNAIHRLLITKDIIEF